MKLAMILILCTAFVGCSSVGGESNLEAQVSELKAHVVRLENAMVALNNYGHYSQGSVSYHAIGYGRPQWSHELWPDVTPPPPPSTKGPGEHRWD